ncbi:MAG: hypothetical protein PHU96_05860 [Candidatus Omnitrophica bacterium]|nr:hypothetical protein [Candidatus Omnitrophota bacterium]
MMKLKQFLRNSVKPGLLKICLALTLICGCTSSTVPTYSKEKIESIIQELCKTEYNLGVKAKLIDDTLWVYLPVEDIFKQSEKPDITTEIFKIEEMKNEFKEDTFRLEYKIQNIPPAEQKNYYQINKDVSEDMGSVWRIIRRVTFSMEHSKNGEPKFYAVVTADIKNAFEIITLVYYLDLKKISYGLISYDEYYHRTIQNTNITPEISGDKDGLHFQYKNISMRDFVLEQITQRIKLKFQKPELDKNADVDKEILKIVANTVKTYDFKDFNTLELNNLFTNNRIILNKTAVLASD